jgi:hypothetical protein
MTTRVNGVESLRAAHHAGVAALVATAREVPEALWNVARPGDKWSPAQIAEHLRLSYLAGNAELDGGVGLRLRTSFWMRTILRIVYLRKILRTGKIPAGARAPREIRPGAGPFSRDATIAAVEAESVRFENALATRAPGHALTHHVFGRLDTLRTWRFMTVHTEHHRRQIEETAAGT